MAAPKGNKYALGVTTNGQPPIYKNAKDIEDKINQYFESLLNEDKDTYEIRPTITGIALYMGFASRQSLYDYAKKEEYSYIISRAKLVVEMSYEEMLLSKASSGAIFALKNMDWKDKTETDHTTNGESLNEKAINITLDGNEIDLSK